MEKVDIQKTIDELQMRFIETVSNNSKRIQLEILGFAQTQPLE